MARFNRYALKAGTKRKDIQTFGAIEEQDQLVIMKYIPVNNAEICVRVTFGKFLKNWNDTENVTVIDTDADQPYKPFYKYRCSDIVGYPAIEDFAAEYNRFMDSIPFLQTAS